MPSGQVSKPLDVTGWFEGRTLIAGDNIARQVAHVGVLGGWRADVVPSDLDLVDAMRRLEALEKRDK